MKIAWANGKTDRRTEGLLRVTLKILVDYGWGIKTNLGKSIKYS